MPLPKSDVMIVITKKDGKKQVMRGKNRWTKNASAYVYNAIRFGGVNKFSYINLYDTNGNFIKALPVTFGSASDTGTAIVFTGTASDTSTDTYTVAYLGMDTSYGTALVSVALQYTLPTPKTKGTTDSVNISWTISLPYT
jgi:hypothetical protein